MTSLTGSWIYRSFRPNNGTPSLVPWAPPGHVWLQDDRGGTVRGKLTFAAVPGLELTISGSVTPEVQGKLPEAVELMATGGRSSVNALRGYFISGMGTPFIVGMITAVENDPGGQPDGTSGPFVLFPAVG